MTCFEAVSRTGAEAGEGGGSRSVKWRRIERAAANAAGDGRAARAEPLGAACWAIVKW